MLLGPFRALNPALGGPATIFPWGRDRFKKTTQRVAARKAAQSYSHDQFHIKNLAETWGWKRFTRNRQARTGPQQIRFSGFSG
jgi:hypothetical protein